MRILIITPSLLLGGTERFIMNFAKAFKDSHLIDIAYFRGEDGRVIEQLQMNVNEIYKFPYYVKAMGRFIKEIHSFFRDNQYDIVYCHANHTSTILYTFPIWRSGTQIWYHSHNTNGKNRVLLLVFRRIILRVCNHLFACSLDAAKYMYGDVAAQVISNCIESNEYSFDPYARNAMRKKFDLTNKIVIGHIGRFSKQKNQTFLVKIFQEIKKKKSDVCLVLVGDGETKLEVIELIKRLGLETDVLILDNSVDVCMYYHMFDVFVLPSLYEGLPFVALEAQASGTPCLLSDNMDRSVSITPLVRFKSINDSSYDWATELLSFCEKRDKKNGYSSLIEKSKFGFKNIKQSYARVGL